MTPARSLPTALQQRAARLTSPANQADLVMATIGSTSLSPASADHRGKPGLMSEVRKFWRQLFLRAFDPYRPELHYMRGPGPAWRAKHDRSSHLHST